MENSPYFCCISYNLHICLVGDILFFVSTKQSSGLSTQFVFILQFRFCFLSFTSTVLRKRKYVSRIAFISSWSDRPLPFWQRCSVAPLFRRSGRFFAPKTEKNSHL